MVVSKRFHTATCLALLAIFLICILTVESHESARGRLNSRCPTCVDNNVHLAVDAQPGFMLGVHHVIEYLQPSGGALGFRRSIVCINDYRAPPASV